MRTFPTAELKARRTPANGYTPEHAPMRDILARLAQARAVAELPPLPREQPRPR
jgi:hypothetical protein